jgi:hypothetical protein
VHVNQTYIVLLKFLLTSLISAFPREFLWRVSMEGYWTIVLLEVRLFLELLCKRANRTTIAFRSLLSNEPSDRSWKNKMHHRHEMLDLVIVDGKARGIIT